MPPIRIDGESPKDIVERAIAKDLLWHAGQCPKVDLAEAPSITAAAWRNGWLSIRHSGPTQEECARVCAERAERRKRYRREWTRRRRAWQKDVERCRAAGLSIPPPPDRASF